MSIASKAIKHMGKGTAIINVCSIQAFHPMAGILDYATTKVYLLGSMRPQPLLWTVYSCVLFQGLRGKIPFAVAKGLQSAPLLNCVGGCWQSLHAGWPPRACVMQWLPNGCTLLQSGSLLDCSRINKPSSAELTRPDLNLILSCEQLTCPQLATSCSISGHAPINMFL